MSGSRFEVKRLVGEIGVVAVQLRTQQHAAKLGNTSAKGIARRHSGITLE